MPTFSDGREVAWGLCAFVPFLLSLHPEKLVFYGK
jgi:hypothetical protein